MALADLAESVNVSADDVRVVLGWLAEESGEDGSEPRDPRSLDADEEDYFPGVITAVHMILNPNSERTVPELYYPELGADWREDH